MEASVPKALLLFKKFRAFLMIRLAKSRQSRRTANRHGMAMGFAIGFMKGQDMPSFDKTLISMDAITII